MKKYLLLLTLVQGALSSWSSDDLSDDPWAFGKSMKASDYFPKQVDQENVEPCTAGKLFKATECLRQPLTKSRTSLNLLADAMSASQSPSGSFECLAAKPLVLVPQHKRYTKYYHKLDFVHRGAAGQIIKLRINRDLPCTITGEVFPATCNLIFNDGSVSKQTPTVFTQQSFEGPHDSYEVPIDGANFNKFVIRIPTLVENLVDKTKDKLPAQIFFHKPDGQVSWLPLELESLNFDKP
jgi:hypothetical protein